MKTHNFYGDDIVVVQLKNGECTRGKVVGYTDNHIKVWLKKGRKYILDKDNTPHIYFVEPERIVMNLTRHPLNLVGKLVD